MTAQIWGEKNSPLSFSRVYFCHSWLIVSNYTIRSDVDEVWMNW